MSLRLCVSALLLAAGCAARHPVQPTPASWTVPADYAHCRVAETVTLPDVGRVVILECPDGVIGLDYKTKRRVGGGTTWQVS